jgi:superfamily II DNA or RNA helicase
VRRFSGADRAQLWRMANGHCQSCGRDLDAGWHADHRWPWVLGGPTATWNGQALCDACNLKKGRDQLMEESSTNSYIPRPWQQQAEIRYFHEVAKTFLLEACPGAGKTKWALSVAARLLREGRVQRIVIVAPLRTVKRQWARDARLFGLVIDDTYKTRQGHAESWNVHGIAVTYGAICNDAATFHQHCALRRTLVILDEIHHAAEYQGWGTALHQAFDGAQYIVSLSGTPFRREGTIPFVMYVPHPETGDEISAPDFQWTYRDERQSTPCSVRNIEPTLLDGTISLTDAATGLVAPYLLSSAVDDPSLTSARLLEALNPGRPYFQTLLRQGQYLLDAQRQLDPRRRGLIIAYSIKHAHAIAGVLAANGYTSAVAAGTRNSPEKRQSERVLAEFQEDPQNHAPDWLIAVRMASEGYDCERLAVLLYATNQLTEWAVVQAIGRVVRGEGTAYVLAPAEPRLARLMQQIFSGDLVVKRVPVALDEDEEDADSRRVDEVASIKFFGTAAEPGEFVTLIDGGEFTQEDLRILHDAAEAHGIRRSGTSDLAHLYCEWARVDTHTPALDALNARADARLAVLSAVLVVRRRINGKVDQLVQRTGRSYRSIHSEIGRRWTWRRSCTLPQLWEIDRWLDDTLG